MLGRVSAPVTTPHNFTLGAIAYQAGVSESVAGIIQSVSIVAVVLIVLAAIRWSSHEVSYLTTVVASQMLSPLLWDHYAVVLLLPVAWLLERRCWWAIAIPLLTALPFVGLLPAAVYPVVFATGLIGPALAEWFMRRRSDDQRPVPAGAAT